VIAKRPMPTIDENNARIPFFEGGVDDDDDDDDEEEEEEVGA